MVCNITNNYNTPTYSQNESASHYTEYEMEKYSEYMLYVEDEVNKSDLPKNIKNKMMNKRNLHKRKNGMWFLEEASYEFEFLPFKQWLLQTERDKKLSQLGL